MKKYYVAETGIANQYALEYAANEHEAAEHDAGNWTQITRAKAIALCKAERERREDDPAFSGYADTYIWPTNRDYDKRDLERAIKNGETPSWLKIVDGCIIEDTREK